MYNIEFIDKLYSTNAYAKEHLASLAHFQVISTNLQPEGHGQFERTWYSSDKNGGNCYISIVLKPKNIKNLDKLTQYASFKVATTLDEYGLYPVFKFPNDVLVGGKKIAGILAESIFHGNDFRGVVVGVGVNLNLDEKEVLNIDIPATSVYLETEQRVDKNEFLNKFLQNFEDDFEEFISGEKKGELLCYQPN